MRLPTPVGKGCRGKRLSGRLVFLFHPDGLQEWDAHLRFSTTHFTVFSSAQLVEVRVAHPPRTVLMDRVIATTPLSLLNPYRYRGPVGVGAGQGLFVGRIHEIQKLCKLERSYALVGPRTIGKTSLVHQAYNELSHREPPELAIRVEFSPALTELDLVAQIVAELIDKHEAPPVLQHRMSGPNLQRFLARFVRGFPSKCGILFLDEADEVPARCPRLASALRHLHDLHQMRLVFVGFKQLRKAVNDAQNPFLMNVFEELPLSGLSWQDCGRLIVPPMEAMGIELKPPDRVVEVLYRESGGAPSRVQLLCAALVEGLAEVEVRQIGLTEAANAIRLPQVQAVLRSWFRESTTPLEKLLATLASLHLPCTSNELVSRILAHVPFWTEHDIMAELEDLRIADVIVPQADGSLDFAFPSLRQLVRPAEDASVGGLVVRTLRRQPVQLIGLLQRRLKPYWALVRQQGFKPAPLPRSPGIAVEADAELLGDAFSELADNACAAVQAGPEPRDRAVLSVSCEASEHEGSCVVRFTNSGTPMPPAVRSRLFEQFASGRGSTGVGLWLVREIVRAHGGKVEYRLTPEGCSRFEVQLPLSLPGTSRESHET